MCMKSLKKATNYFLNGKLKYISRFSIIGFVNTLVDLVIFTFAHSCLGINYVFSQVVGYSCGVLNSFIFNRKWTFKDRISDKKVFNEFVQFVMVNLISLCITTISINLMVKDLKINVYISKIIVIIIAQITNFLGYRLWVFKGAEFS